MLVFVSIHSFIHSNCAHAFGGADAGEGSVINTMHTSQQIKIIIIKYSHLEHDLVQVNPIHQFNIFR